MVDVRAIYQSAIAEYRARRMPVCESLARQILDQDPSFARAWNLLGILQHSRGDTSAAIPCVERAIELEPQWPDFHSNLGNMYWSLGRFAEAERALRTALQLSPGFYEALATLGHVLCAQNRCDESIDLYNQALAANPRDAA